METFSRQSIDELLGSLREVTAKAPDFTPAHSDLGRFSLYLPQNLRPDQAAPKSVRGPDRVTKCAPVGR
jgi:hypothetical protein